METEYGWRYAFTVPIGQRARRVVENLLLESTHSARTDRARRSSSPSGAGCGAKALPFPCRPTPARGALVMSLPTTPGSAPVEPGARRAAWWGDRGVRTKVLAAVAIAALVAVLIGVLGLFSLDSASARTQS